MKFLIPEAAFSPSSISERRSYALRLEIRSDALLDVHSALLFAGFFGGDDAIYRPQTTPGTL